MHTQEESAASYKLASSETAAILCFGCKEEEEGSALSWEELQRIETTRREILERVELPFGRILLYWNGTCLRALV